MIPRLFSYLLTVTMLLAVSGAGTGVWAKQKHAQHKVVTKTTRTVKRDSCKSSCTTHSHDHHHHCAVDWHSWNIHDFHDDPVCHPHRHVSSHLHACRYDEFGNHQHHRGHRERRAPKCCERESARCASKTSGCCWKDSSCCEPRSACCD